MPFQKKSLRKQRLNGQRGSLQLMILPEYGVTIILLSMIYVQRDRKGINPL